MGNQLNDSWNSTDGVEWNGVTLLANFGARSRASGIVFNDKMWLTGGLEYDLSPIYYKDVWYSTDGADWTAATRNAEFGHRVYPALTVFNDKIYLIGGEDVEHSIYYNDVWTSSNGVAWTRILEHGPFATTGMDYAFVKNGILYLYQQKLSKVWNSKDGKRWNLLSNSGDTPTLRTEAGNIFFNDFLFSFGGYDTDHDVDDSYKADINRCFDKTIAPKKIRWPWEW
jgi:hypothetical protein